MSEEKQTNHQEQAEDNQTKLESIGAGTPLSDTDETPLYVIEEKHEPVVGIGAGTPLYDADEQQDDATSAQQVTPDQDIAPAESLPTQSASEQVAEADTESVPTSAPIETPAAQEDSEETDFAAELEQSFNKELEIGDIIQGTVIRIDEDGVIVDVGYKSEGVIAKQEFLDAQGCFHTQVGDQIDVLLERKENKEGLLVLSKQKVDRRMGWNKAKVALANGNAMEGLIYEKCKGGLMVDLGGINAFLPGSHLDIKPSSDLDQFIGRRYKFKVIKMNRERKNIVVSRRNQLIDEQNRKRDEVISKMAPGRLVHGIVKNLTNYGAFVDIGGVDALLHINDMSWSKVTNPRAVVAVGDELEVMILSIDQDQNRIALGLKQKSQDPWQDIEKNYPVGSIVEGQVVSVTDFGAFLSIGEGLEGLLPVSEMSWTKRIRHPKEILKIGDSVRVKVLALDSAAKKITMGLKQTEPEPFSVYIETVNPGDVVEGEVKSLVPYGAFVEIGEGVSGLIHISDLSWDNHVKKTSDILSVGDRIKVKILEIQKEKKKISLGLKQLSVDPWDKVAKNYSTGKMVSGKVVRQTKFGVFIQLEPGIEGMIHVSQLEKEKGKHEPIMPEVGSELSAKVIKVNKQEHKIGLSVREFLHDQEKAEMEKYLSPEHKPGFSLGDAVGDKMKELLKKVNANQD